jgi:hypothetical protein
MKSHEMEALLSLIANSANRAAAAYGAHYYEHERAWQWRPCPEPFAVQAAHESLREAGYGVTAEAHQGGVWIQAGKKQLIPEGGFRRRYDLAVWAEGSRRRRPVALCEFKWLFGKGGFESDAENLALAKHVVGSEGVLCLLVAHKCRSRLDEIAAERRAGVISKHAIRSEVASHVKEGQMYQYGFGTEEPVYFRTTAYRLA